MEDSNEVAARTTESGSDATERLIKRAESFAKTFEAAAKRRSVAVADVVEALDATVKESAALRTERDAARKETLETRRRLSSLTDEFGLLRDHHERVVNAFHILMGSVEGSAKDLLSDDQKIEAARVLGLSRRKFGAGAASMPEKSTLTPVERTLQVVGKFEPKPSPIPAAPVPPVDVLKSDGLTNGLNQMEARLRALAVENDRPPAPPGAPIVETAAAKMARAVETAPIVDQR